nr:MAG TPA: hypothetical protein [Crassvirales sp.]
MLVIVPANIVCPPVYNSLAGSSIEPVRPVSVYSIVFTS